MEIKDPIHGSIEIQTPEAAILESREFQRLRAIKQLGFAEYSFPGATHNRYLHSVGVLHLAGLAFDQIFRRVEFSSQRIAPRFRQVVRLGALLHDIGHGPLSHTTEEVMPQASELKLKIYAGAEGQRRASHEDYTIKYLTDSGLTKILTKSFPDIKPEHIACLVDRHLTVGDDFFMDKGRDFRPILSQIVSSELDVDRLDYLERDAYFCGTNYGKVETGWLISNMSPWELDSRVYLALNRRALYTFDDFLISRHHMHLMVYFHHKSIIYEEMLMRYLTASDCTFKLPADIDEYTRTTDFSLYEHLASVANPWATRIAERNPYRMLFELHSTEACNRPARMRQVLESKGIDVILASSEARLSKYHSASDSYPMFVVDQYDPFQKPVPVEDCTEIFKKYEETRQIDRLYVAPDMLEPAREILISSRI